MSIPVNEQETTIQFSRDSTHAYIYTSDTTIMTKLDKKIKDHGDTWSLIDEIKDKDGKVIGKKYLTPKTMISFRNEKSKRSGNPNAGEALKRWREKKRSEAMVEE